MKATLSALAFTTLIAGTSVANASALAVTFSGGALVTANTETATFGYNFRTKSAIVVDGLAFYDHGSDGLAANHRLGLWNVSLNTKVSEATITNANSTLIGPSLNSGAGQFRVVDIAPLLLLPEYTYVVGGQLPGTGAYDPWFSGTKSEFNYILDELILSAGPGFSTQGFGLPSISYLLNYGPVSFRARAATVSDDPNDFPIINLPLDDFPPAGQRDPIRVPEPGMLGLIGLSLAGLALTRRRCEKRRHVAQEAKS